MLKRTKNGILINLKVSTNSSKNEIIISGNELKVKLTAQPVDGKANKALVEFLSKELNIPKSSIEIVKGLSSKDKVLLFKVIDVAKIKLIEDMFDN